MPHASVLVAPSTMLATLAERPEFDGAIYHVRGSRFPELPPEGLVLVDLPMYPQWKSSSGPYWYEPNPEAYPTPPEPFERAPVETQYCEPLVFDPEDIARRFPVVHSEMPPEGLLRFCKGLARASGRTIAWYNYLDRGDTLYHDAAWFFGRGGPTCAGPGITFTSEAAEEELVIYNGFSGPKWRGWLLWGNERIESKVVHQSAAELIRLRFGLDGPGPCFPYDFPSYSNVTGNYWAPFRV